MPAVGRAALREEPVVSDVATVRRWLEENFAPWVRDLAIEVLEAQPGRVVLRIPATPQVARVGGIVCGQAMMALADTAMALALATARGAFVPTTTVSQTTTFLRPASGPVLMANARVVRAGRTLAYGEITLHTGDAGRPVAHAVSTYMLLEGAGAG